MDALREAPEKPSLSLAKRTSFQLSVPGSCTFQLTFTGPLTAASVQGRVTAVPALVTTTSSQSDEERKEEQICDV